MSHQNLIFVISAPSGTGKTSLVKSLMKEDPKLRSAITHTTRKKRPDEADGVHYHFVNKDGFIKLKTQDFFIESAEIYGEYYGTSKKAIENILTKHQDVIINLDWQGAQNLREIFKDQVVSIFVLPPSINELRSRMTARGDHDGDIEGRLKAAEAEIAHAKEYNYRIMNDNFDHAFNDLKSIIRTERLRIKTKI